MELSIEERNQTVLQYLGIARKVASKFTPPGDAEFEDLFQEGVIGLIHGVEQYVEGQAKQSTFLWHKARGAVLDALRRLSQTGESSRRRRECKGYELTTRVDMQEAAHVATVEQIKNDGIEAILQLDLTPRERYYVQLGLIREELKWKEEAERAGVTPSTICVWRNCVRKKVEQAGLTKEDIL